MKEVRDGGVFRMGGRVAYLWVELDDGYFVCWCHCGVCDRVFDRLIGVVVDGFAAEILCFFDL